MKNLLLVAVLVIAGLATCGWYGPSLLLEAKASQSWPSITGVVVEAHPTQTGSRKNRGYGLAITYRYTFEEAEYTSERYGVGTQALPAESDGHAVQLAGQYPPGRELEVFVDPEDPESAVLARGGTGKAWATIGFGIILTLAGGYVALKRLR